jgi:hypothetical protein
VPGFFEDDLKHGKEGILTTDCTEWHRKKFLPDPSVLIRAIRGQKFS